MQVSTKNRPMIDLETALVGVLFGVVGAIILEKAYKTHARSGELADIETHENRPDGEETVLEGPVTVSEPAVPERAPPDELETNGDPPALWAWRVRRKVNSGSRSGSRWRTVESGLAVGDFAVEDGWETIQIDADSFTDDQFGLLADHDDPFDTTNGYFGEPERDVRLGDPDPVTRRLEDWGILGENGLLGDLEFTISFGRKTLSPDRYQATVVRDGDEVLVRGEVDDTAADPVLRGTQETPPVVATGDLEATSEQFRSTARKQAIIGAVLVLLGVGSVVGGLL